MPTPAPANPVHTAAPADANGVRLHAVLREAIDASGWKHAAVAAAIGVPPSVLSEMLAAVRPIQMRHVLALPRDVQARFARGLAEAHGHVVVDPLRGHDAIRSLVAGLVGVLATPLPARTRGPIKAEGKK